MLLLSIVIMIAALLVVTGRSTLLLGASYSDREQAYYAAECGIAYAQYCISKYKDWVADETSLSSVYNPDFTDFTVSMAGTQKNCVRGIIKSSGSEFYITFYSSSWNDSTSTRKDVDRSGNLGSALKYYSYNNLSNDSSSAYSKYLNDEGKGTTFRAVSKNTAHIVVEGRCNQAKRYAEAILTKADTKTGQACSIAAGGFEVDLKDNDSVFMVDAASGYDSRIRSMGDITVTSATGDENCYQIADNGLSCTGAGTESSPTSKYTYVNKVKIDSADKQTEYGIACENKPQGDYLQNAKLEWDDVTKKYLSGSTYDSTNVKTTIKAGTYVYMNSKDSPDTYNLCYFPPTCTYNPDADKSDGSYPDNFVTKNYSSKEDYKSSLISSSRSGDLTLLTTVTKTQLTSGTTYLMTASNPIGIEPVESENSFAIAIYDYKSDKKYSPSESYRASVKLNTSTENDPCLITQTGGNLYVEGELSGKGKIMSGGEMSFQGKSILEADTNSANGVSIYSQGSVNIDPIKGSGGTSDPSTYIKEAWGDLITKQSYTASGDYYNTGLTSYKDLQKLLLSTEVSYNGNETKLSSVLKDGYGYDKAAIQEMINTIMTKNSYIGKDSSTSGGTSTFDTGSSELASVGSVTMNGETFKVSVFDDGFKHICITNSDGETMVLKVSGAGMEVDTNHSDIGTETSLTNFSTTSVTYDATSGKWGVSGDSSSNNLSSAYIMMHNISSGFVDLNFNDTILKGLVYTWKDFKAKDLGGGSLSIRGGIVAYGGNPATDDPGTDSSHGKVSINNGKYVTFTYDPDYMKLIFDCSAGVPTKRIMQSSF